MAYGNWGATVYKNGERQENREDNTPYLEDKLEAGYWQAFGGRNEDGTRCATNSKLGCVHASLGSGEFRLCGYKSYPIIYWQEEKVDFKPFLKGVTEWRSGAEIEGELNGYKFKAKSMSDPESIHLELIEPDGTIWTGVSGFGIGSGHEV